MTPRTDWKEEIVEGEHVRFDEQAQQIAKLQRRRSGGRARALHVKGQLGAKATVTILPDLPDYARAGIFATPATYQAWVRFSNAAFGSQNDRASDLRGLAVKLLGVPGGGVIPELKDSSTQDFLAVSTPSQGFRNSAEFVFFVTGAASPLTFFPRAAMRFGLKRTLGLLRSFLLAGRPIASLAEQRYWSVGAVRWGAYAARYQLVPAVEGAASTAMPSGRDYLSADLVQRLSKGPIEFDLAVQFYCDPQKTPLEDPSFEWREDDAPLVRVARITIPQQDLISDAGRRQQAYVEALAFDPWHSTPPLHPVGELQRARLHAYKVSGMTRKAAPEPKGTEAVVPADWRPPAPA